MSGLLVVLSLALVPTLAWGASGELGGEFNRDSHGILNASFEHGDGSFALITDTIDVRYQPEDDKGRAWVASRTAAFAAGMVISPWADGEPAPALSTNGMYTGLEFGGLRYGPHGLYGGAQGLVRWHTFYGGDANPRPVGRFHAQPQLLGGWWRPWLNAWAVVGVDLQRSPTGTVGGVSPHVRGQAVLTLEGPLVPMLELRGGWAESQDVVTLTRLGGLNPYVVPLAGAAWAEFWVEDYAAGRTGVAATVQQLTVSAFVDGAVFDDDHGAGFGLAESLQYKQLTVASALGISPFLDRPEGDIAATVFVLLGVQSKRPEKP